MATYLDFLSFKAKLPWYKKILFPRFLNKKEYQEYLDIVNDEKTELDEVRDYYFFCWNEYLKTPTYQTEKMMKDAAEMVRMYQLKEYNERNNPE